MIVTGKKFSKPSLSRVINGDVEMPENESEAVPKIRLDLLLVQKYPTYNRASLQVFTKSGFVKVNGEVIDKPGAHVPEDAEVALDVPPEAWKEHPEPEVIYEDENVLVVNKPEGLLSVSKSGYCPEVTLEHYGMIVHRLDRGTSGVVILAKTPEAQEFLRKQFQQRKVHKTYYAIVEGRPKLDEALIDLPIARNLKRPTTFIVDPTGRSSQTYYKVIKTVDIKQPGSNPADVLTLLELKPVTGRTHQLRVHLHYMGTPILGDEVYGAKKTNPNKQRVYLHAVELEITIPPHDGETLPERRTFRVPLPKEFEEVITSGEVVARDSKVVDAEDDNKTP